VLHAGGQFLADVAALVERDAVQLFESRIEREHPVGPEIRTLGDAQGEAMREIVRGRVEIPRFCNPSMSEFGQSRIGGPASTVPGDAKIAAQRQFHFRPQAIHREALQQRRCGGCCAINKYGSVLFVQQEVEHDFALRRQQRSIQLRVGRELGHIVGY
jgi:hypothetical protein